MIYALHARPAAAPPRRSSLTFTPPHPFQPVSRRSPCFSAVRVPSRSRVRARSRRPYGKRVTRPLSKRAFILFFFYFSILCFPPGSTRSRRPGCYNIAAGTIFVVETVAWERDSVFDAIRATAFFSAPHRLSSGTTSDGFRTSRFGYFSPRPSRHGHGQRADRCGFSTTSSVRVESVGCDD